MGALIFRLFTLPLYLLFGFNARGGAQEMPTLLLLDYKFDDTDSDPDGIVMELIARRTGLIAWIMSKLGLLSRYYLRVTRQEVQIAYGSMNGTQHFIAPLSQVTTSDLALQKPALFFYIGLVAGIGSLGAIPTVGPVAFVGVIIAALFLLRYYLAKRLVVAFSTSNLDDRYGLSFRTSRITGKHVSFDDLQIALDYVNNVILNAQAPANLFAKGSSS